MMIGNESPTGAGAAQPAARPASARSVPKARLRRQDRLSGRRAFSTVFDGKHSVADGYLVLYVRRNTAGHARLGLSVGRKHGSAPRRNRIKRLLREAFRLSRESLPAGFDLVCVPRVRDAVTLDEYRSSLVRLARQAVARADRSPPPGTL